MSGSHERGISHGVMEADGAYNWHAKVPAGGAQLALRFLEQAVANITFNGPANRIVIADYGSSQGKNSLAPMRIAIKGLRARLGPECPIFVVHIDQAMNDFNTLFDVLHSDPDRYCSDDPNIFPSAIGRSFYENVFPQEHVDLGWSSYAAVWLSRIPALIPDHFIAHRALGRVREAFESQAALDWQRFLALRATELRVGGRLVVVLPGLNDDGVSGFENLMDNANAVLEEMVEDGTIQSDERKRMVLGAYPRRRSDLLVPFQPSNQFRGLTVECIDLSVLPDFAWTDYERDKNQHALAVKHAQFFRAVFIPSLACALDGRAASDSAFADRFQDGLERRLAGQEPQPMHSFVQTIVLSKCST